MKINSAKPILQRITQLRNEVVYSAVTGNYKNYKTAIKEHARLTVENYDLAKYAGAPNVRAPLFSMAGLRLLKVRLLDFFRIKTPEEKELRRLAEEAKQRKYADKFIKQG